jgi:antitoxin ParD1/3/4
MNISLTKTLENFIHQKVKEGLYHSSSEVIREALRGMIHKESAREQQLAQLNQDIEFGVRQIDEGQIVEGSEVFKHLKTMSQSLRK